MAALPTDALLRRHEVQQVCAISRTRLWEMVTAGSFPAPVATGPRARAWKASDIQAYIESLAPANKGAV
jgi:prophage regulatory protein